MSHSSLRIITQQHHSSKYGPVEVLECKSLEAFIRGVVKIMNEKKLFGDNDAVRGGDKGGSYIKFHFVVICGQSAFSLHVRSCVCAVFCFRLC